MQPFFTEIRCLLLNHAADFPRRVVGGVDQDISLAVLNGAAQVIEGIDALVAGRRLEKVGDEVADAPVLEPGQEAMGEAGSAGDGLEVAAAA